MQAIKILIFALLIKVLFVASIISLINITTNLPFLKESSPFIISTLTLILTFLQLRKNDLHNKLSVRPLLNFIIDPVHRPGTDGYFCIFFIMENSGLGPANISDIYWMLDGKKCNKEELSHYLGSVSNLDYLHQQHKITYTSKISAPQGMYLKQEAREILITQEFYPASNLHPPEKREIIKILDESYQKILYELQFNVSFKAVSKSIYGDNIKYIDTVKKFKQMQ